VPRQIRFLAERAAGAVEEMDRPDCDPTLLRRTYQQFPVVNRAISGWRWLYRHRLRPLLNAREENTLLDIGSGGGDIVRFLARWAAADGIRLAITGVDPDERAHAFAVSAPAPPGVRFRRAFSSDLVAEGLRFDLVTSNHLLHHLTPDAFAALLADSERLSRRAAIHSDIRRSPAAYWLFAAGTLPFVHGSYIRRDGLTSIRRSYTGDELRRAAPPGWNVEKRPPFRNVLTYRAPADA
jgi:2-polyprenyl-3-methyl-5-hydroxy-6-metoxy-1,4-benzoquinol methylase